MWRLLLTFVLVALAVPTNAADARLDRLKAAFSSWAAAHGVTRAGLAMVSEGKVVPVSSIGSYAPDMPAPVASLSKAINGICVIKLVDGGKLAFGDTIAKVLPEFIADHKPVDARAADITIAQLLTHTSGITNDPSQGPALNQFSPFVEESADKQVAVALSVPLGNRPGAKFTYNNMNFAILQMMIAKVTGADFADYCNDTILKPIGVTDAILNPSWRATGAYGGWLISAEDYANFLQYFSNPAKLLKTPLSKWPKTSVAPGLQYGVGAWIRRSGSQYFFSHEGDWRRDYPPTSYGAYFSLWGNVGAVATYAPAVVGDEAIGQLDRALYKATH